MKTATVSLQRIQWQFVSAEGRSLLKELPGDSLSGEVIKAIPKRRVVRRPGVFAKEVYYWGWAALLKTLGGGTACREGRISLALAKAGISVPEVFAYGVEKRNGLLRRDLLLTREEPRGKSLLEVMRRDYPTLPFRVKLQLVGEFACFIKGLHNAGVLHADLHIGNILWLPERDNGKRFVLLDTDRVTLKNRPLSSRQRTANLALLLGNLWTLVSRSQRFRFLRFYGIRLDRQGRRFITELEAKALKHSNTIWQKKAQRCLCNNRHFGREKRNGFTVFYSKRAGIEELLDSLLADPDRLLEDGQIFKAGNTVRAAKIELNGKSYFLKRFNCKGWSYRIKNTFRRSRAVRSWLVSWGFYVRSLPVAEPFVCLEERRMRLLGRSYVLFDFVEATESLARFWPQLDAAAKKRLLTRLALLLGRLHLFGGLHGDLKWSNILVRGQMAKELYLIDLDGSKIVGTGKPRTKRKDLERFLLDLTKSQAGDIDKALFLKCWKRWSSCTLMENKKI